MNNLGMRRKKYRRTRRRRRRRQRGGGKKKGKDKTRKLVKAAKKRSRKKQPPQLLKKLGIQKYQTLNEDNIELGGTIGTNQTPSQENSLNAMFFLDTESNINSNNSNENGPRAEAEERALSQFWLKKKYNPLYEPGLSKKKTKKATGTYAQLPKKPGTYAQLPPLIQEGQVRRDIQTNGNAHQLASALGAHRRRRSPSPLPVFNVDEYFDDPDGGDGFADILPIGSEIVGHSEKNGKRFYKIRLGPEKVPKGFRDAGKPHNLDYAYTKVYHEDFDAEQLENDAGIGLPDLQKLIDNYVEQNPSAGEENSLSSGFLSESSIPSLDVSNGGRRRRKRRKKRTRRKRRSRKTRRRRRRRRKQRGGFDPIPKFRYKPKVFLNASAPKEAPIPPKPWW